MTEPSFTYFQNRFHRIALGLIIVFYLINGLCYLNTQSITSDEGSFFMYAVHYLHGHPERTDPRNDNSKMPVSVINTIPRIVQQLMNPHLHKTDWGVSDMMMGRNLTLLLSVCSILLVYRWASAWYGRSAGLFAAFLMSFCPNNLANAGLFTTDSYATVLLLASMYLLWKYCTEPTRKNFLVLSCTIALAQLVKQSLFHLYMLVPVCLLVHAFNTKQFYLAAAIKKLVFFLIINWFIINLGYYFSQTNTLLGNYHFMSQLFSRVQHYLPSWLPVPLPKPFVDGLDMAKYYDQLGGGFNNTSSFGKVTILGHEATGGSFWYYYFVSLWFKTPVTYLVLFCWCAVLLVRRSTWQLFLSREFFAAAPIVYFLTVMSFFYKTQCGIRHLIFLYPFIFILGASVIPELKNKFQRIMIALLSLFLVVSVTRYWNNYYPYTNEFIMDKKMAYAYVGTGNLEFLQSTHLYRKYLLDHPGVTTVPRQPRAGTFLIDTENYLDIWNRHQHDWIKTFKPSGIVAYSGLLITVRPEDLSTQPKPR